MGRGSRVVGVLIAVVAVGSGALSRVHCQEPAGGYQLSFGARVERVDTQDELVSPRVYSAFGVTQIGGSLARFGAGSRHELTFWYGESALRSGDPFTYLSRGRTVRTPETTTTLGEASYAWARSLGSTSWRLGAQVEARVQHTEYELGSGSAEAFLYAGTLGIAVHGVPFSDARRRVAVRVSIPVVGWVSRPPPSTVDEARLNADSDFFHRVATGSVTVPYELRAADLTVRFSRRFGSMAWGWAAARAGLQWHDGGGRYAATQVGFAVGLSLEWGGER